MKNLEDGIHHLWHGLPARDSDSKPRAGSPCHIKSTCLAKICTVLLLLSSGCGYQTNNDETPPKPHGYQWRSLYREDVQTVAVPIFTNRTYYRNVEFALSKAVISQMEARTPYKVVDRDHADTILEGEIVDVRVGTVSESRKNSLPQEQLYTIKVNFTWKNLHTGHILAQQKAFEQSVAYYPTLGEGQYVGSQDAVERLGLGIVQELEAEW